jgi:hypothetical protein
MIVALARKTAHRTLALCHHWRDAGGCRLTSGGLKRVTGTSITTELFGARAGFSAHCRIDDPRWRKAVIRTGSNADLKNGPAAPELRRCACQQVPPRGDASRLLKISRIELAMGYSEDLSGWLAGLRGVGLDEIGVRERGGMGIAAPVEIMPPG